MNIAIVGYGKMGKAIKLIAKEKNHSIIFISNSTNELIQKLKTHNPDVAIEFSTPSSAFNNVSILLKKGIPVICGTTGWDDDINKAIRICENKNGTFLYASNFSIGVNILFSLNKKLAELTKSFNNYKTSIEETHHIKKLDAPSGTAITLANDIISINKKYKSWSVDNSLNDKNDLKINSNRVSDVPGTHVIKYKSDIDTIELKHITFFRKSFAIGAILAAEWILEKKGIYSINDVFKLD